MKSLEVHITIRSDLHLGKKYVPSGFMKAKFQRVKTRTGVQAKKVWISIAQWGRGNIVYFKNYVDKAASSDSWLDIK